MPRSLDDESVALPPGRVASVALDLMLVGAALGATVVAVLDLLGLLDNVQWLQDRILSIVVVLVSMILIALVVERSTFLRSLKEELRVIKNGVVASSRPTGPEFLTTPTEVTAALESLARGAEESLLSIGGKSVAKDYLSQIEAAVTQRDVAYHRLLDGLYITHEIHQHLRSVREYPNVQIAWTHREKFGNISVSERRTLIAFPAPHQNRFSLLSFDGGESTRRYTEYFMVTFRDGIPIRTDASLQALCATCSGASPSDDVAETFDRIEQSEA